MAKDLNEKIDTLKTAAEHKDVITKYLQTGKLDRSDALEKYKKFNLEHPEYFVSMDTASKATGNNIPLEMAADDVIVGNLNLQLKYLLGENILEEISNGTPKTWINMDR